ncbi:MAG: prolipoprotein diacylglyceryl transferase [Firmicutes bacterium]|nr:prolipoprotein diacylglyceryl transferase [Bacillota bacterium]
MSAYVLLNLLAAVLLVCGAAYFLRRDGLSVYRIILYTIAMTALFFIGSRLLYGLLYYDKIILNPMKLVEMRLVNFSLYGGLMACGILWWWLMRHSALDFWRVTDRLVPILGISIAISKLGCFINSCCYGIPTRLPWGMIFERADQTPVTRLFGAGTFTRMISGAPLVHRHPTQLYEGFFALLALCVSLWLLRNGAKKGISTTFFILLFSGGRLFSFFLRDFPNASVLSSFIRGPVIYGVLIISFSFVYMHQMQSQKPHE